MKKLLLPTIAISLSLVMAACGSGTATVAPTSAPAQATTAPAVESTATTVPAVESATEPATVTEPTATVVEQATEAPTEAPTEEAATETPASDTPVVAAVANTKLNLNTVTANELTSTIPGFSSRMVREFQEYRPYISIQQFRREIGKYVDDATVAGYEQYVYVPVDVNESDAATLQQLPGVDDAIAAELIAGRPYDSNEAFLAQLAQLVTADDVAAAAGYLQAQ